MTGVVGIDVGGTFTDLTFSRDGGRVDRVIKVLSTPQDPSQGLVDALLAAGIEPHQAGDSVHLASPGGGGFGDPLTRSLDLVEQDLNQGLVDRAAAEAAYGVVVGKVRHLNGRAIYRLDRAASVRARSKAG